MFKKSLIAVASLVAAVGTAQACSTLIIGKNVSETGNRDCHEFCVHGIIGARYTGTPHEHDYQETNLS